MRFLLAILLLASPARAQDAGSPDGGTPIKFYRVPEDSHILVGIEDPIRLPPGYFIADHSFDALDAELKRLQAVEADSKKAAISIDIPLRGWLLGIGISAAVTAAIMFPLGFFAAKNGWFEFR